MPAPSGPRARRCPRRCWPPLPTCRKASRTRRAGTGGWPTRAWRRWRRGGRGGAPMVGDNPVATGLAQRPRAFGAVASVYSMTKAISGHCDVLGGAVVSRDAALLASVRDWRTTGGGIPGPFEAWLVLRGMKTLPLRIARMSDNAQAIAEFLAAPPRVRAVHYPGVTPPTLEVARRQMGAGVR